MSSGWLKVVHLLGVVLWTGSALHVSRGLAGVIRMPEAARPAVLSWLRRTQLFVGFPGLLLTLAAGIGMLVEEPEYLRQPWMHAKLGLVTLMIGAEVLLLALVNKYRAAPGGAGLPRVLHAGLGLLLLGVLSAVFLMH